ncbi:hypothetical protein GLOIN_2v1843686 [Rhizophagus irregularis DAOM 181602=DAOM 197198]|uniref:C2H2-type domain-containing protein n=1 Tax=Rhizophagus irregularis (strain DAOM 181602 / DAOM 197198 / MUCL 43194) TaxID=747089 RepID=A0A2P4PPG8_RHIID|nr:hypothetical protein GLOIN_2v1843686 [Rhizophagus irregularis DAOM 181602=DAOM 197198]POG67250.1 hypothetical protein GLOIN_2v1843686 [Rhizophagus irregularis DAOM 181602=DAOM 197198]|eukprot:XP_025174116.1 hypothetical protein GLOIN_2v1843686 [Rhizophagus irregularis DAOM 181602=DAOM 197198]
MSKSIVPMPFVCKWSVAHPTTCRFKTREELIIHIDEHIINFYDKPDSVDSFYTCPWEGCMNRQSDIIELKGHLHKHARQRPFKDLSVDNLPESSQEVLSEYEHEVRGMKAFVEYHKGSLAAKYFGNAIELMGCKKFILYKSTFCVVY